MNEAQKKQYKERYLQAKQKGVKFWPDIIYKDLIVSFAIFLFLVGLATFIGVAREPRADPSDSSYLLPPPSLAQNGTSCSCLSSWLFTGKSRFWVKSNGSRPP